MAICKILPVFILLFVLGELLGGCVTPASIPVAPGGDSRVTVETLSKSALGSSSFEVYEVRLNGAYDRAFASVVQLLNTQGDPVEQADSDKGYIVTAALHRHGGLLLEWYQQYFVVLRKISDTQTLMTFKLCGYAWDSEHYPAEAHIVRPIEWHEDRKWAATFANDVQKTLR